MIATRYKICAKIRDAGASRPTAALRLSGRLRFASDKRGPVSFCFWQWGDLPLGNRRSTLTVQSQAFARHNFFSLKIGAPAEDVSVTVSWPFWFSPRAC
jgi:hypothetical protein